MTRQHITGSLVLKFPKNAAVRPGILDLLDGLLIDVNLFIDDETHDMEDAPK